MSANLSKRFLVQPRRGATAVEFALIIPLILVMFLGAIEVTRLNYLNHSAVNAAYVGARKIIVPGGIESEAVTEATNYLNIVRAGAGAEVDVVKNDETVEVTVTIPVEQNAWGILKFSRGFEVSSTCILTRENTR